MLLLGKLKLDMTKLHKNASEKNVDDWCCLWDVSSAEIMMDILDNANDKDSLHKLDSLYFYFHPLVEKGRLDVVGVMIVESDADMMKCQEEANKYMSHANYFREVTFERVENYHIHLAMSEEFNAEELTMEAVDALHKEVVPGSNGMTFLGGGEDTSKVLVSLYQHVIDLVNINTSVIDLRHTSYRMNRVLDEMGIKNCRTHVVIKGMEVE